MEFEIWEFRFDEISQRWIFSPAGIAVSELAASTMAEALSVDNQIEWYVYHRKDYWVMHKFVNGERIF